MILFTIKLYAQANIFCLFADFCFFVFLFSVWDCLFLMGFWYVFCFSLYVRAFSCVYVWLCMWSDVCVYMCSCFSIYSGYVIFLITLTYMAVLIHVVSHSHQFSPDTFISIFHMVSIKCNGKLTRDIGLLWIRHSIPLINLC